MLLMTWGTVLLLLLLIRIRAHILLILPHILFQILQIRDKTYPSVKSLTYHLFYPDYCIGDSDAHTSHIWSHLLKAQANLLSTLSCCPLFFLSLFCPSVKAKEDWSVAFPFLAFNFVTLLNAQQMCRSWGSTFAISGTDLTFSRCMMCSQAWKR